MAARVLLLAGPGQSHIPLLDDKPLEMSIGSIGSSVRLVTFDAFNTLFKPRGGLSAQYVAEAGLRGINVSKTAISASFGKAIRAQTELHPNYGIKNGLTSREWWEQIVRATFLEAGVSKDALAPHFDSIFSTLYNRFASKEGYELFPDVTPTLKELNARGMQMGVISNTDERLAKVIVSFELDQYLDFVVISAEFGEEKPSPLIFEHAINVANEKIVARNKNTGVSVPLLKASEVLHVGDDELKFSQAYAFWKTKDRSIDQIRHIDSPSPPCRDYQGALSAGMNAMLLNHTRMSYDESIPEFAVVHGRDPSRPVVTGSAKYQVLRLSLESSGDIGVNGYFGDVEVQAVDTMSYPLQSLG
ncbi:HAD-like domain-containing protein [Endogone sp. FLAS-F59071]|nr:HAD-like domain-containing protein [Endogone sp. FLAS-F59071]|eukprot:RUS21252.1 HAD-like domain-containing protein [Endogone sp. FLAS-F59071]